MKNPKISLAGLALVILVLSCVQEAQDATSTLTIEKQLRAYSQNHAQAEANDDLEAFLSFYEDSVISMPEYQLMLEGRGQIKTFYQEMFGRQHVKLNQREPQEFIHMGNTIVEIGIFKKHFTASAADTTVKLDGKYWHVWEIEPDGKMKIKGESYGYFQQVSYPDFFIIRSNVVQPEEPFLANKETPFELKAYNALMEKGVRNRDGVLRANFFTADGAFYPYADTTVTGMDELRPYMIAYNQGNVNIDSISCYTYDFERHGDFIIEYDMFKVSWRVPEATSGRTEGKGIRIWKRQQDLSLKLFREIGTHNHLN